MKWDLNLYSFKSGAPPQIEASYDEAEKWCREFASQKKAGALEFEGYTDEIHVFRRQPSGKRVRFATLQAAE